MEFYNYPEFVLFKNVLSLVWIPTHHLSCLIITLGYPQYPPYPPYPHYPQPNATVVPSNTLAPILSSMPSCLQQAITLQIQSSLNNYFG